jgi:hypothetical protein
MSLELFIYIFLTLKLNKDDLSLVDLSLLNFLKPYQKNTSLQWIKLKQTFIKLS